MSNTCELRIGQKNKMVPRRTIATKAHVGRDIISWWSSGLVQNARRKLYPEIFLLVKSTNELKQQDHPTKSIISQCKCLF